MKYRCTQRLRYSAESPVEGKGIEFPDEAVSLKPYSISQVGGDILIESEVIYRCSREL